MQRKFGFFGRLAMPNCICRALLSFFLLNTSCGSVFDQALDELVSDLVVWNTAELASQGGSEPNSYIIGMNLQQSPSMLLHSTHAGEFAANFKLLHPLLGEHQGIVDYQYIATMDRLVPENSMNPAVIDQLRLSERLGWQTSTWRPELLTLLRVDFKDETAARTMIERWVGEGKIFFAEPNYLTQLSGTFADAATAYASTYSSAWWLGHISLNEAFTALEQRTITETNKDEALSARPPVIAVLDSGVDYEHSQLKSRMWRNENLGASSCVNDVYGCNTTRATKGYLGTGDVHPPGPANPGEPCPQDGQNDCGHGTHVAGIIASEPGQGAAGVCPVCKIMALRVVKTGGGIPDSAILNAFKYVTLFKRNNSDLVRVVNASIGKFQRAKAVGLMVRLLKGAGKGILVIGAAGNEDTMTRSYPGAFPDAIAVAALDFKGRKAPYSNFGVWVDVAAPGGSETSPIISTVPGGGCAPNAGTSMAAPVVSGIAGLLLAQNPDIDFQALRSMIIRSANKSIYESDNEDATYNRSNYYRKVKGDTVRRPMLGSGVVNAKAAIDGTDQGVAIPSIGQRVEAGCGVVGHASNNGGNATERQTQSQAWYFILVISPILTWIYLHRRRALQAIAKATILL